MKRLGVTTLAFALAGCTADFFVGPTEGGSSTSQGSGATGSSSQTSVGPSTTQDGTSTTQDGTSTTQASTTQAPEFTTSSTTDEATTAADTDTDEGTASTTGTTTGEPTGETEEPADCIPKNGPACEEAFPNCLWTGEACTLNPCDVGDERNCLGEAPECIWAGGGCVPSGCDEEAECGGLEPAPCEEAKGCLLVGVSCFIPACVPCGEIEDPLDCDELPNCAFNEGREACLPQ